MKIDRRPRPDPDAESPAAEDLPAPRRDPQLVHAIERFIGNLVKPGTRLVYSGGLEEFLKFLEISKFDELLAVTPEDVVRYRNSLQKRKLAASTVVGRLAAVRSLYARLVLERRIPGNPAAPELVERPAVSQVSHTESLTLEEVKAILALCDGTLRGLRDRALFLTLYYEGLRRSEASKLNYRDVVSRRGMLVVRDAKTAEYDPVRLDPKVRKAIDDYLEVLCRDLRKREPRPEDPVFVSLSPIGSSFGRRLSPTAINDIVKARAKAAGITRRITAHSWRATTVTHARNAGVPLEEVQRHVRHRNSATTVRYDKDREIRKNSTVESLPDPE